MKSTIRSGRRRGFTLIEMLVVLMIMGLFVGLVSAIMRPDDRAVLRFEAERLSQLLDLAATEAQLTGKYIAWTTDGPSYRFWRSNGDSAWLEIRDGEVLLPRTLPFGMMISGLRVENMRPQGAMRLEFPPQGVTLAFDLAMSLGAERYAVTGSPVGDLKVFLDEGQTHAGSAPR